VVTWWSLLVLTILLFATDVPLGYAARWAGQNYDVVQQALEPAHVSVWISRHE
jgi:hypothetical protein